MKLNIANKYIKQWTSSFNILYQIIKEVLGIPLVFVVNIEDWYIHHKKKRKVWLERIYLKKYLVLKTIFERIQITVWNLLSFAFDQFPCSFPIEIMKNADYSNILVAGVVNS